MRRVFLAALIFVPAIAFMLSVIQLHSGSVTLDFSLTQSPGRLQVNGTTNLPNGALLEYDVIPSEALKLQQEGVLATGIIRVRNELFQTTIDTSLLPLIPVEVVIRFQIRPNSVQQPPHVVSQFGRNGERIGGQHQLQEGKRKWIELRQPIEIIRFD